MPDWLTASMISTGVMAVWALRAAS
jgi:hypothetical protein